MNFLRRASRSLPFSVQQLHHFRSTPPSRRLFTWTSRTRTCQYSPPPHQGHHSESGRWYDHPLIPTAATAAAAVAAAAAVFYYWHLETIPYTKRRHFVPIPPSFDRKAGEYYTALLKSEMRSNILPPEHSDSVRVGRVSARIFAAVERALGNVKQYRHLRGLRWEVIVVEDGNSLHDAACLPAGKIFMCTRLLRKLKSDAEIAAVIGHEVGHAIARHHAEGFIKYSWFWFLQFVWRRSISMPEDSITTMVNVFHENPYLWDSEFEADQIGLFVIAESGYDPRVAPTVYEKFKIRELFNKYLRGETLFTIFFGGSAQKDYFSTHPPCKQRAEMLRRDEVMDEALQLYQKSIAGRAHEGSL